MAPTLGVLAALCVAGPAHAEGVQFWPALSVSAPVVGQWQIQADLVARTRGGYAAGQAYVRLGLLHPIAPHLVAGAGYLHAASYSARGAATADDQLFQQLVWDVPAGPVRVTARTRLEQRFQQGVRETSWRLRQQIKLLIPVGHHGLRASLYVEPMFDLNHTPAVRQDFDQMRSFAGVNLPVARDATLEIGYLGQFVHRPTGDYWVHAVPMTLSVRL